NNQWNIDCFSHFLGHFGSMLRREVLAVGISTLQPKANYVCLVCVNALLGPSHGIAQHILEGLSRLRGPFFRFDVQNLKGELRRIWGLPLERVETVTSFSTYHYFTSWFSYLDFADFSGVLYLWQISHTPPS